jgi:hypothetical protein
MGLKFSNFGKAIVASAPSGTAGLSFTVEAGKGLLFPALSTGDYFYGIFKDSSGNREIVKVEARSSDAMTIAVGGRGLDGTTARTWAAGDYFVAGICNLALQETAGNANLSALGSLTTAADKLPYFTGAGAAALTTLSAFIRTLLDDADAEAARATLEVSYGAAAYASSASAQSVTSGTWTKVTLGTEGYDTHSTFASSTFTAPIDGYYNVFGLVRGYSATLTSVTSAIYKNGSRFQRGANPQFVTGADASLQSEIGLTVSLVAGDTLELWGNVAGGTPKFDYTAADATSYLTITFVRPL